MLVNYFHRCQSIKWTRKHKTPPSRVQISEQPHTNPTLSSMYANISHNLTAFFLIFKHYCSHRETLVWFVKFTCFEKLAGLTQLWHHLLKLITTNCSKQLNIKFLCYFKLHSICESVYILSCAFLFEKEFQITCY